MVRRGRRAEDRYAYYELLSGVLQSTRQSFKSNKIDFDPGDRLKNAASQMRDLEIEFVSC